MVKDSITSTLVLTGLLLGAFVGAAVMHGMTPEPEPCPDCPKAKYPPELTHICVQDEYYPGYFQCVDRHRVVYRTKFTTPGDAKA